MRVEELQSKIARDLSVSLINFILKNWRYEEAIMTKFSDQIKANCAKFSSKLLGSHDQNITLKEAGFEAKQLYKSKIDLYQLAKELINHIGLQQIQPIKKDNNAMLNSQGMNKAEKNEDKEFKFTFQFAQYLDRVAQQDDCEPVCSGDVEVQELFDAIHNDYLPSYQKEHLRFYLGSKALDLSQKVHKYFSIQKDNIIRVELCDVIKVDLCSQKVMWLPNKPQISLMDELRARISFDDVKDLNSCLCSSRKEAEESNEKTNTNKFKYYLDMLQFNFENKLLVEETDLSKIIKTGPFENQVITVVFKMYMNMQEQYLIRDERLLLEMMYNVHSVQQHEVFAK